MMQLNQVDKTNGTNHFTFAISLHHRFCFLSFLHSSHSHWFLFFFSLEAENTHMQKNVQLFAGSMSKNFVFITPHLFWVRSSMGPGHDVANLIIQENLSKTVHVINHNVV